MKFQSIFRNFSGLVVLALALSTGSSMSSAQAADSEQISNLLSQAKSHAVLAENDAATLEAYTRSPLNWKSHAVKLIAIKEHINALTDVHKQLSDLRPQGSPWQQGAIDQVDPLLQEMADLLTATINHLNDHQSHIHMQAYRDYVKGNYELTNRLAKLIDDFVDYDEAKSEAEALEQKLELPAAGDSM